MDFCWFVWLTRLARINPERIQPPPETVALKHRRRRAGSVKAAFMQIIISLLLCYYYNIERAVVALWGLWKGGGGCC